MSSRRERPYVSKPSEAVRQRLMAAASARLLLVQEPGPTSFVLKAPDSEKKYRVFLGGVHTCSCGASAASQPCEHTAFVLVRIFRLEADDSRVWQQSLLDSELEKLIEDRARAVARLRMQAQQNARQAREADRANAAGGKEMSAALRGEVARKPIDEEEGEPCPICYEDILLREEEEEQLDWCRQGCGKSVHRSCLKVWADHQATISKALSCPFCRCNWGEPAPVSRLRGSRGVSTSSSERGGAHSASGEGRSRSVAARPTRWVDARCRSCRTCPIYGKLFRCLICPDRSGERIELCSDCFGSGMHSHHPFACKSKHSRPWVAAPERASIPSHVQHPHIHQSSAHRRDHSSVAGGDNSVMRALQELQHREIGPDDYELLLALHQISAPEAGSSSRRPHPQRHMSSNAMRLMPATPSSLPEDVAVDSLLAALNERDEREREERLASQGGVGPRLRLGRPAVAFGSSAASRPDHFSSVENNGTGSGHLSLDFGLVGLSLNGATSEDQSDAGSTISRRTSAMDPRGAPTSEASMRRHRSSASGGRLTGGTTSTPNVDPCGLQLQPTTTPISRVSSECTGVNPSTPASDRVVRLPAGTAQPSLNRASRRPGGGHRAFVHTGAIGADFAPSLGHGLVGLSCTCSAQRPRED